MAIFDNKDNVTLEATKIGTSYLVNVPTNEKILDLASLCLVSHNHVA